MYANIPGDYTGEKVEDMNPKAHGVMTTSSKTNNWNKREAKLEEIILKYCIKHGFDYKERLDRIGLVLNISEFIQTAITKASKKKCAYCEESEAEVCFDCAECKAEHV